MKWKRFGQSVFTIHDVSSPQNALWTQWISTVGGGLWQARLGSLFSLEAEKSVCLQRLFYWNFNPIPKSHWNSEWNLKATRERRMKEKSQNASGFSLIPPCRLPTLCLPMPLQASSLSVPFGESSFSFCTWLFFFLCLVKGKARVSTLRRWEGDPGECKSRPLDPDWKCKLYCQGAHHIIATASLPVCFHQTGALWVSVSRSWAVRLGINPGPTSSFTVNLLEAQLQHL